MLGIGTTTGISAADRAATCLALTDGQSTAEVCASVASGRCVIGNGRCSSCVMAGFVLSNGRVLAV